jgi:hypothetical protein
MRVQRPCSCGGSNENCMRCFGRGFIEGSETLKSKRRGKKKDLSQPRSASLGSLTAPSSHAVVKCPACEFKGETEAFTRHFALQHGGKGRKRRRIQVPIFCIPERLLSPAVNKARNNKGTKIVASSVPLHSSSVPKSVSPIHSKGTARPQMKSCPLCDSQVREDRLQRHMSSRCALRSNKTAEQRARAAQQVKELQDGASSESMRHKGKVEAERPSWWSNLDATKNYGYPARESGRYGSYPSHDGFDDESNP